VASPTTITGTVPTIVAALVYAPVDVRVTNPGAPAAAVGATLFRYRAQPTVTAVANPANGPASGGRAITVTGTGFVDGAKVFVDGTEIADTVFVNATTLRARVPAHAAGAVGVAVKNPEDTAPGPTRATTFTYVDDPHTATGQNAVSFVLDGENYFETMRQLFERVRQAPRDPKGLTYVRLAFWMIEADVTIGDRNYHDRANHTLLAYIEQVARAGHHVEVIMWRPKKHEQYFGEGKGVYEANKAFADKMYALDVSLAAVDGAGRARVYFEAYEGETGASNHQKIAIFSIAGQRQVMVGGLNLSNGYFAAHDHRHPNTNRPWHDVAMYLRGPVTDDVEKEWKRRWDRTRALEAGWFSNQLGAGGEFLARDFAFFAETVVRQREIATEENTTIQTPDADDREVTIALTRSVGSTRYPRLRDKIIERINAANNSIYFENYHFSDPDLVRAIVARHAVRAAAAANLAVVVVVPYPMSHSSSYMTRRAWLHMILQFRNGATDTPYCREVIYDLGAGAGIERVTRAACGVNWAVTDCYDPAEPLAHDWLENDTLTFTAGVAPPVTVRFSQILAVDGAMHFYAPFYVAGGNRRTLYTHSKVASFDDQWLVVGSANWSFRSMQYDGEISAFVNHGPTAANAVQRLLRHYNSALGVPLPLADVEARARANMAGPPNNHFGLYTLDRFNPANIGAPHFGLQRQPPMALDLDTMVDFFRNPAEPNYTWL
jgi:phosphatidylserine/phosphatidylglycerophosphate/cardiolipin synthase-like enzyme